MSSKPDTAPKAQDSPEQARQDRRTHERHQFERTAQVSELDETGIPGPAWECRVSDLSRSGMGLRSRRMVYTGRLLLIELSEPGQPKPRVLCGMVCQSRYETNEGHILGVQFRAMPKSPAVDQWIKERSRAA